MDIGSFQDNLKQFLSETGLSKNELAARAGVPQSQVSDWSNGKGKRFTQNAKKVMDAIEMYRRQSLARAPIPEDIEDAVRSILKKAPTNAGLIRDVLTALERNASSS